MVSWGRNLILVVMMLCRFHFAESVSNITIVTKGSFNYQMGFFGLDADYGSIFLATSNSDQTSTTVDAAGAPETIRFVGLNQGRGAGFDYYTLHLDYDYSSSTWSSNMDVFTATQKDYQCVTPAVGSFCSFSTITCNWDYTRVFSVNPC